MCAAPENELSHHMDSPIATVPKPHHECYTGSARRPALFVQELTKDEPLLLRSSSPSEPAGEKVNVRRSPNTHAQRSLPCCPFPDSSRTRPRPRASSVRWPTLEHPTQCLVLGRACLLRGHSTLDVLAGAHSLVVALPFACAGGEQHA